MICFFYACDIDNIEYGVIYGRCKKGDLHETSYKWLSQFSLFFPMLFVSNNYTKLFRYDENSDKILFAFNSLYGFPIKYDEWMKISGILANVQTNDFKIIENNLYEGLIDLQQYGEVDFKESKTLDEYIKKYVLIPSDQFVVSSLDLRKSCSIVCESGIQKSQLIKKGFQWDSIKVVAPYARLFKFL